MTGSARDAGSLAKPSSAFRPASERDVQTRFRERVGSGLRSAYGDVLAEPLPAQLVEVLRRLEKRTAGG